MRIKSGHIGALIFSLMLWIIILYTIFYSPLAFTAGIMAVMFVSLMMIARR